MARKTGETCRNCGAELAPGAAFCTLCGTVVTNRAASPGPSEVPLGGHGAWINPDGGHGPFAAPPTPPATIIAAPGHRAGVTAPVAGASVPGIIPVGGQQTGQLGGQLAGQPGGLAGGPLVAPQRHGSDARLEVGTALVPGGAGRRLVAKLIDGVVPGILLAVGFGVGTSLAISGATETAGQLQINLTWLLVLGGAAWLLSLAYGVWLWIWEARSGKTPGNVMMGLRTTSMDGRPAGLLAIFLRYVIIALGSIVPTLGTILVIISNAWDSNDKRQGWHDKVAHTLVFNVAAGRDPLETGGVAGRTSFAPAPVTGISPVQSPIPAARPHAPIAPNMYGQPSGQASGQQGYGQPSGFAPVEAAPGPITSVPGASRPAEAANSFAPPPAASTVPAAATSLASFAPSPAAQAGPAFAAPAQHNPVQHNPAQYNPVAPGLAPGDDDLGETRVRPSSPAPAPSTAIRLTFDDGRSEDIATVALIGRNPAGYDGEMIERLVSVHDSSRSVSKTHLHVRASAEGLWVTDRNSTNGSAITNRAGQKSRLAGGTPALAEVGARVHFGDRSFVVGQA